MAEDLLMRVLREIRERKQAAHAAYAESQRLERALAALGSEPETRSAPARDDGKRRSSPRRRPRAAPGANRDAILAVVRERPGVTTGEISQATGIPRSTVAPALSRLVGAGGVERTELPGGGVGFRPARERPSAPTDDTAGRAAAETGDSKSA